MQIQNSKELATPTDLNRAVAGNASFIVLTSVTIVVETIAVEMMQRLRTTRGEIGTGSTMVHQACSPTG
jgi:hypothetical protein